MKNFTTKSLIVGLLMLASVSVSANDIHVATSGNDANDGSETTPLQTIQKALDIVKPGDRILIHEGNYNITKRLKIPALATTEDLRCEMYIIAQ